MIVYRVELNQKMTILGDPPIWTDADGQRWISLEHGGDLAEGHDWFPRLRDAQARLEMIRRILKCRCTKL